MGRLKLIFLFVVLHSSSLIVLGSSSKVLILVPISTRSENHFFAPIIHQLAISSPTHEITVVTSERLELPLNVRQIIPHHVDDNYGALADVKIAASTYWDFIFLDPTAFVPLFDSLFNNKDFKEKVLGEKYDLIISNLLWGQMYYGIIHKNGAPFIHLHSWPVGNHFLKHTGMYLPPSNIPTPVVEFSDKMSFKERLINYVIDWAVYFYHEYKYLPLMESVYKRHMGENLPSVHEVQKNLSMTLMNTHFLSTYHRALMPDVVEIGGVHCKEPKPLPKELEALVSVKNSPDGFILVSFGSVVHGSTMSEEARLKFVRSFAKLKQRVIWKWETEEMENQPKNVVLKKWLPQQDLLGHPNIRLFISHTGLLSTQQIMYHGVPVLSFGIFFDQLTNGRCLTQHGMGKMMDFWNFSEEELSSNINSILNNSSYKTNSVEVSRIFKDTINSPAERAVYWINHVINTKGAPHLRSSAREMTWIQFHSIDVLGFLFAIILAFILGTRFVLKWIVNGLFPKRVVKLKSN